MEEASIVEFKRVLKDHKIDLFFDIGANVGIYSWIARSEGVLEIFLVEPDSTNQRLLSNTIRRNAIDNCFLLPFAMSKDLGIAQFLVDNASGTTGSLVDDSENESSLHASYGMNRFRSVPTFPLDIFCDFARGKRTMLKIDVEGAEDLVLEGANRFLTEVKPFILIECFDRERLASVERLGYSIVDLAENYNYLLKPLEEARSQTNYAS